MAEANDGGFSLFRGALAEGRADLLRRRLIAHRGWHNLDGETVGRPLENTREAYLRAVELGLPFAECDVWNTADGELVLGHDWNMRSMAENEDDPLASAAIAELQWADLQRLQLRGGATPVPLSAVLDDLAGTGTRLLVELKSMGAAAPLAAALDADERRRGAVACVISFSLATLEAFAGASKSGEVRLAWLVDNPVTPYAEELKNEGETTFDYGNETLTMFLARLGLTGRIQRLGCGLHVQHNPCLTPSHVYAWRSELASLLGAGSEGPEVSGEGPFVALWYDGGADSFDRAAELVRWLPAVSAVNTDLPAAFWDGF